MTSSIPGAGLLGSSDGKVAVEGVFSAGRVGLGDRGVLMVGIVGAGVGEDDDTGDADDEADPPVTVTVAGGDKGLGEAAEVMMASSSLKVAEACCQLNDLNRSDGNACGGQRVSRGSKHRKEEVTMPAIVGIYGAGTGIEKRNNACLDQRRSLYC